MNIFPTLSTLDDVWSRVSHKPEIRLAVQPNGTSVVCYMIAGRDTFDGVHERECRGVTFGADGQIVGRPLHKFFNVGERPETMPETLDWSSAVRVMDKRDGSLIHTVAMPGGYDVKSKKSFDSSVALAARQWIAERPHYDRLCRESAERGVTALFEWTSPDSRIVIDYGTEAELQLLHVRQNESGAYAPCSELATLSAEYGVPLVGSAVVEDPMRAAREAEGVEGWVLQFANGDMVKLKTQWYLDRHHCMTALRRRDVARSVVNESIDDLKSKLTMAGVDVAPILAVEAEALAAMNGIRAEVGELLASTSGMSRKDIAIKTNGHPYFKLLMQAVSGREPDVRVHFERHVLDGMFDLSLVMNTGFNRARGVAQEQAEAE